MYKDPNSQSNVYCNGICVAQWNGQLKLSWNVNVQCHAYFSLYCSVMYHTICLEMLATSANRSQRDIVVLELFRILEASLPGAKDGRASEAADTSCEMDNTCRSRKKHTQRSRFMKYINIPTRGVFR